MEEILASIRRIISEDDDQSGQQTRQSASNDEGLDEEESGLSEGADVLNLTRMVQDDGSVVDVNAGDSLRDTGEADSVADTSDPSPDDAFADDALDLDGTETTAGPAGTSDDPARQSAHDHLARKIGQAMSNDSDLISETTREATASAFGKVSQMLGREGHEHDAEPHAVTPLGQPGQSLEDIVREMLRPMLKDWLDENLPHIVESVVDREIRKMVRRLQDD